MAGMAGSGSAAPARGAGQGPRAPGVAPAAGLLQDQVRSRASCGRRAVCGRPRQWVRSPAWAAKPAASWSAVPVQGGPQMRLARDASVTQGWPPAPAAPAARPAPVMPSPGGSRRPAAHGPRPHTWWGWASGVKEPCAFCQTTPRAERSLLVCRPRRSEQETSYERSEGMTETQALLDPRSIVSERS
jgi:hypothetical protein